MSTSELRGAELVASIQPRLPEGFAALSSPERQQAMDRAKNALQVRRNVLELVAAHRLQRGLILQYEADAQEVQERLERELDLPGHRRKHLLGRMAVYQARAERSQELLVQYQLEIDLYRQLLEQSGG